jgi:hemolysin activation/secretion protein
MRGPPASLRAGVLLSIASVLAAPPVSAQLPQDPTGRTGEPPPLLEEQPRPTPPPVPILPEVPPPAPGEPKELPVERVFIREIRIVGSTVFTPDELAEVAGPYVNRRLSAEDLEALRRALTSLYINRGYVNSGAILPDQTVAQGVVTYQVIEGRLDAIEFEGNRWFRDAYLRRRIALGAGPPLNVNDLQERLQLLLEDQQIGRLNAELRPGLRLGEADLRIRVQDRVPFRAWIDVNNYQSPSVGAERGILNLEDQNLTGWGDVLTLRYGESEGLSPLIDVRYVLPFTARDTALLLQYRKNAFDVVDEQFVDLEIESDSDIYTVTVRHPVYRTLNHEVAVELTGERLSSETSLLGEPFSLSAGAEDGRTVVTAIRTAQEWIYRTQRQVIAARSRFSLGVDALGATVHSTAEPESRFVAWLGQFQWARRLGVLDSTLIFRADAQLTPTRLLTLEQFAVGGRYSVRGYRENTLFRDNGAVGSLEARVPVVQGKRWTNALELAPFFDYGRSWNTKEDTPDPQSIYSAGIGLRWSVTLIPASVPLRAYLEVYWGYPLVDVETTDGDLQDRGLHFQFVVGAF